MLTASMLEKLFNTTDYNTPGLVLNFICASLWAVSYVLIILRIRKHSFIEMPVFAALGNIAWELLWSTVYQGNLGALFNWGVKLWLILDVYIIWHVFKLGTQQIFIPEMRRVFRPLAAFTFFGWAVALFLFTHMGLDNPIGGRSAIMLNLVISVLYIFLLFRTEHPELMSRPVAWCKGVGTGCYTASVFFNEGPQQKFIEAIGILIFLIDASYIWLLYRYRQGKLSLSGAS